MAAAAWIMKSYMLYMWHPFRINAIVAEIQQMVADRALFYPFGTNLRLLVTNPNLQGIDDATLVAIHTFNNFGGLYYAE